MGRFETIVSELAATAKQEGCVLSWGIEVDPFFMKAELRIVLSKNSPRAFSTKKEVVGFIKGLETRGLKKSDEDYSLVYFSGVTMNELLKSNFPRETWPKEVTSIKTFGKVVLPQSHG